MARAFSSELFAADEALEQVMQGVPFRDAYRQVADHLDELEARDPRENIRSKTHMGAPGNLGLDEVRSRIKGEWERVDRECSRLSEVREALFRLGSE